jgi:hypothetical protein
MKHSREKTQLILFLVLVFIFSALIWTLVFSRNPFAGGGGKHYIEALMWCPAFAAFASIGITKQGLSDLGLSQFNRPYALAGYLLPLLYALIAYALIWILRLGSFPDRSAITQLLTTVGWHTDSPALFTAAYFLLMATTGMLGATARALGHRLIKAHPNSD